MGEKQVVIFELAKNIFGIPIGDVQEIIKTPTVTVIPNTPEFFKGVISLRDRVVPVLGLSEKFGLKESGVEDTRTIIINVQDNTAGIIVDSVSDVLRLDDDSIETEINFCDMAGRAITGIARLNDRLVILLNLEQLLASDQLFNLEEISQAIAEQD